MLESFIEIVDGDGVTGGTILMGNLHFGVVGGDAGFVGVDGIDDVI